MKFSIFYSKLALIIFVLGNALIPTTSAYAIDNPDAPDYIGQFKSREKYYLEKIDNPKNSTRAYAIAYHNYQTFLDEELNAAYKLLMSLLPEIHREPLKSSQREWIKFRDAEFNFIKKNWTRENFGSSYVNSRGRYRCSVVKNRVIRLLLYVINY